MSKEFEEYERACAKIKEDNAKLLADFGQWLEQKGLAKKTITEHVKNADFYINTFLLYDEAISAREGAIRLSTFLGSWFPRKALWASPTSIKENAATLKKFYTFMRENGQIDADDLRELKETIKEEMAEWLEAVDF